MKPIVVDFTPLSRSVQLVSDVPGLRFGHEPTIRITGVNAVGREARVSIKVEGREEPRSSWPAGRIEAEINFFAPLDVRPGDDIDGFKIGDRVRVKGTNVTGVVEDWEIGTWRGVTHRVVYDQPFGDERAGRHSFGKLERADDAGGPTTAQMTPDEIRTFLLALPDGEDRLVEAVVGEQYRRDQVELAGARAEIDRLRAERNAIVSSTELGALSERLEEDNAATDAKLVRGAMHRIDVLTKALTEALIEFEGCNDFDGNQAAFVAEKRKLLSDV